ncbi:hypothetical protein DPMN_152519 [Dreissena polymorpha]|uniref:Tyr recombinase domain-containing protein n=1 Tax=Dreissena polymorpha TaxID=45954 RepID=A0A9D4FLZ3_DREPO|nr:hypothetical protein DPMN_152519 [Dreissena polymorpha]
MAERGDLTGRKTNHSARKTTCTTLLHNKVAPSTIQQLTGHKIVQSVNNYAKDFSKCKKPCPTYYQRIVTNTK